VSDRGRPRNELNVWWRLGVGVLHPLFRLFFRLRVIGAERVPESGPAVVAANHVSILDGLILGVAVGSRRRRMVRFLAAAEVFRPQAVGWFLRRLGQIPIRRGQGDTGALDEAVATVRSGALVGIFPEGRVNPDEGLTLPRGRSGIARLALGAGVPVVPVAVWGTQVRWPRSGIAFRRPLRPALVVCFGEPELPSGDAGSADDIADFAGRIMERIGQQIERARVVASA
jgi:1-acyl-sn-glycerol-3-phosphate acyltransferase